MECNLIAKGLLRYGRRMAHAMFIGCVAFATFVSAEVRVSDVKISSRYPWNGKVDVYYTLLTDTADSEAYVNIVGYAETEMRNVFPSFGALSGDGATGPVKQGRHHIVWDVKEDLPHFTTDKFSVKIFAGKHLAPYLVIDLSGGTSATNYPIRLSMTPPDLSNDACRTTNLWMRLVVPGGPFMMGTPPDEIVQDSNSPYWQATLTNPYYIGVFEVTQRQWNQVMGNWPSAYYNSSVRDARPVERVSWNQIGLGGDYLTSLTTTTTFMDTLRKRTLSCAFPMLMKSTGVTAFTLPSETEWEFACRAGTLTSFNNGKNLENTTGISAALEEVGRYIRDFPCGGPNYATDVDLSAGTAKVGSYKPNALGLYDMHGNVYEWCAGQFRTGLTGRVIRGGTWGSDAPGCRSAYRDVAGEGQNDSRIGFRLSCPAGLH